MRQLSLLFISLSVILLAACETQVMPVSYYAQQPGQRTATIDGTKIHVLQQTGNGYVAWGGGATNTQTQYQRQRAIELVSGCRVEKVTSKKADAVVYAYVQCNH